MRLVTIDLGKFKSVACLYLGEEDVTFRTIETRPQAIHDLLVAWSPDRLVIEVGTVSGWVYDVARALGIEVQVGDLGPLLSKTSLNAPITISLPVPAGSYAGRPLKGTRRQCLAARQPCASLMP